MSAAAPQIEPMPLTLHFSSVIKHMNAHEFFEFCQTNRDLRIELTSEGDLIVMPPTGSKSGHRNFTLTAQFGIWVQSDETGFGFDSSTGFTLPNGAVRAPDLAWIRKERWEALTEDEQEEFAPICPDFVVELRSRTDRLETLKNKMQEYIDNGVQLGWLIDPFEKTVYIYRPDTDITTLIDPETLSGEPLLPGFTLTVRKLWQS